MKQKTKSAKDKSKSSLSQRRIRGRRKIINLRKIYQNRRRDKRCVEYKKKKEKAVNSPKQIMQCEKLPKTIRVINIRRGIEQNKETPHIIKT